MREQANGEFTFGMKEKVAIFAGIGSQVGLLVTALVIAVKGGQFAGEVKSGLEDVKGDVAEIRQDLRAAGVDRWTRTEQGRYADEVTHRMDRIENRVERLEQQNAGN